jgi:hypothetical protein
MNGAMDARRTDVADGDNVDEVGIEGPDEDVPFVASADDANL